MLADAFNGRGKVEISRFKGLGEMPARYLKATTMDPAHRDVAAGHPAAEGRPRRDRGAGRASSPAPQALVETLMGRRPELRFDYIQKNARFARDLDV